MKRLKNRGFTLVELVAIIVILATIFLVAVPMITNTAKNEEKEKLRVIENVLCDAGKSYIYTSDGDYELNNQGDTATLFISELVEYGIVDPNLKNPVNHESINDDRLIIETNSDLTLSCTYQVTEKITVPTTENARKSGLVYNGSQQTLLKDKKDHVIYSIEQGTNAGNYNITASIEQGSIAVWKDGTVEEKSFTCSIAKANDTINVTETTQYYTGNIIEPTITTTSGTTATATYYSDSACTIAATPIGIGEYYLTATTAGNGNYNSASTSCKKAVTINPVVVATNVTCDASKIYDGTTNSNCTIAITNKKGNDDIEISGTCAYNNANVGVDKVINCTNLAITGTSIANYTLTGTTAATIGNIHNATLTFDPNDGTLSGTSPLYVRKGQASVFTGITNSVTGEIPAVTRTGYTFNGWYSPANIKIINPDRTLIPTNGWVNTNSTWLLTSNQTLSAKWTPNIYTIALNNQSATTTGTTTIYEKYNTGYYLEYSDGAVSNYMTAGQNPITTPTKTGHTFNGYYTAATGGTQYIAANGKITENASTTQFSSDGTLFAQWANGVYTITLDNQSATTAGTTEIYEKYDTGYYLGYESGAVSNYMTAGQNPITKPTKTGYTFQGYYTAATGGTQYIDANGKITGNASTTQFTSDNILYAHWVDDTKPSPTITGGSTLKTATQTVTLKCSDGVGVTAYYFGTTNPTSLDSITTTTSLSSLTGSGLSQNLTASGTYYLACRDSAGNFEKTSITIRKYEVQNVLITTSGTAGTYTSDNYVTSGSTSTYYVKDGTSLTLANTYTTTDATGSFLGYTTAAPSATAQTPSTTAPTVSNNTTKYYMWFNRSTFTVTLNAGANGSLKGERIDLAGNATANAGGSNTITVRYGEKIKATATPQTGYSFNGFSGGYLSGTTNPQTGVAITEDKTITASWKDTNPPSLTLSKKGTVNGFNGWKLTSTASLDLTNQIVSLNSTGGAAMSPYYQVDEQNYGWSYDFQSSSAASMRPNGGDYTGTRYFDSKFNAYVGANGYSANGQSTNAPALNTWTSIGPTNYNQGTGIEYFNIDVKLNAAYSTPVTKYRNFKVYGDIYAKDKYTISLTASDAEGSIATKKYASGSQSVAYFENSGTSISGNSFDVTANGTYTVYVADNAGNGTVKTISVDKIDKTAPTITSFVGKMLNTDPTFASGTNSASIYNNSGGGTVTVNRVANSEWPDGSGYVLEVKTTGTASPGIGGFVQYTQSYANGEFYHVIVAKVPVGYSIEHAENATGNGRTIEWLTSTAGTGKFETYIYKHKCGSSGTFSSFGHVYLIGNAATSSNPVTWYVAYSSMFDVTNPDPTTNYIVSYANDTTSGIVSYAYTTSNSQPTSWKLTQTSKYAVNVYPITSNSTYYAWFMDAAGNISSKSISTSIKPVKIYYHPNGGTVGTSYTTCNNGWVCTNSTTYFVQTKDFGSSGDLYNTTTFGISRTGYSIPDGTEWCTQMNGGGTCFDHDVSYTYATYKNAAQKNLTDNYELDLYTHWNPNTYTISLNANGGSGGTSSVNIVYDTTQGNYPSITAPTRNGYTFNGFWDTSAASGGTQWYNSAGNSLRTFNLTSNTTWYARWSPNTYTVTLNANGGSGGTSSVNIVYNTTQGNYPSITAPTRTGYAFNGFWDTSAASGGTQWYNSAGNSLRTFDLTSNTTWYARWTPYKLTLKYNVNGGSIETGTGTERWRASNSLVQRSTNSGSSWSDITATLDITTEHVDLWNVSTYGATKTGYHIDAATAYNTKTDGTGVNIHQDDYTSNSTNSVTVARLNGGNLTADKTINIYANWKINTNTLTVNPNGGSVTFNGSARTSTTSATQNYNTTIAVPNASGKANSSSTANKPITFNQNGGTYNSSTNSTTVNSTETTTTTYSFSSWSNSGTCGSMSGTTYTFPSNNGTTCTKTASWSSSSSKSYSAITAQAAPSKAGNSFDGWYTAASGGTYVAGASGTISAATVKSLVDNGTTTLYAHWTPLALTMSAPTPTGTAATGTGTTKTAGLLVGATVTFTCSGQSGNYPSTLAISGGSTVTNSSNASSISATYTINSPSTSFTISATCTGAAGNTKTVTSVAKPIYRQFQLLYQKNGASAIGSTSSSVQTLAANSTSGDGGTTFTLPSSITCVNNGRSCTSSGWDLETAKVCPRFAKGAKVNVCTTNTSGCSGTAAKSSEVPGKCAAAGSTGTIQLGAEFTARYVYAISYSTLNNPTKLKSAVTVPSSVTSTKNDGNIYIYGSFTPSNVSITMTNRCYSRSDGKKIFAYNGGGQYAVGTICSASQSSCSKAASTDIFKSNYSFGCMSSAGGSSFTTTF